MNFAKRAKNVAVNSIKEAVKKHIIRPLKPILIKFAVIGLIAIIVMGGINAIFESVHNKLGLSNSDNPTITRGQIEEAINNMSPEELESLNECSVIKPSLLPNFMNVEDNSYPKKKKIRIKTIVNDGVPTYSGKEVDCEHIVKPYKLPWQLTACIYSLIKNNESNSFDSSLADDLSKILASNIEWYDDDEYVKKTITTTVRHTVTENNEGDVISDNTTTTITKVYEPILALKSVQTVFKSYDFKYKKNILTRSQPVRVIRSNTTPIKDKKGNVTGSSHTSVSEGYNVYEDQLASTIVDDNCEKLLYVFNKYKDKLSLDDIVLLEGMIQQLPDVPPEIIQSISAINDTELSSDYSGGGGPLATLNLPADWKPTSSNYQWPTPTCTKLGSPFGLRMHPVYHVLKIHNGQDIDALFGTPVVAVQDGIVARAYFEFQGGNTILIDHPNNFRTGFCHLSRFNVKTGETVKKGDIIAWTGNTGAATTGPHLHFSTKVNGQFVDPLSFFK